MPSPVDATEIAELMERFGTPLRWRRTLDVSARTMEERKKKNATRRGEVVFAMPRPEHLVLLHTKSFYPPGSFRLLTGGIDNAERVEAAAQREIMEETSLKASLTRLLGIVEFDFRCEGDHTEFVSYVFLTTETTGTPHVLDEHEQIAEFREVAWSELGRVAERLEKLPGDWHDWGVFRATPHHLVLQAIQEMRLKL